MKRCIPFQLTGQSQINLLPLAKFFSPSFVIVRNQGSSSHRILLKLCKDEDVIIDISTINMRDDDEVDG